MTARIQATTTASIGNGKETLAGVYRCLFGTHHSFGNIREAGAAPDACTAAPVPAPVRQLRNFWC